MQKHDNLGDFSTDRRVVVLSGMALGIGAVSALVAYALVWLIAVITNLAYYQRFSSVFVSPAANRLGGWAVLVRIDLGLVLAVIAALRLLDGLVRVVRTGAAMRLARATRPETAEARVAGALATER
jgi:hypothetical protein